MTTNTISNTLSWQVDQSSITAAQVANQAVADSLQAVADQSQSVAQQMAAAGASAQDIFDATGETISASLTAPLDAADASVQNLIHDIGDLGKDIQSIPEPDLSAFGVADDSGGDGSGGGGSSYGSMRGLRAAGRDAGLPPEVSAIAQATAYLGPFGLVLGVVGLATKAVTDASTAYAASLTAEAAAYNKAQDSAATQTTAQLKAAQAVDIANVALKQQESLEAARNYVNYVQANPGITIPGAGALAEVFKGDAGELGGLKQASDDAGKALASAQDALNGVNIVLAGLPTTSNDLKSALQALEKDGMEILDAATKQLAADAHALAVEQEDEAARRLQIDQMTTAQRQAAIEADERQINVLTRYVGEGNLNEEALKNVAGQVTNLNADLKDMNAASGTYGDQLAAEDAAKQKILDANNNYLSAITAEDDAIQKVSEATATLAQDTVAHQTALSNLQSDYQTKVQSDQEAAEQQGEQDLQKHLQNLAQIDQQYATDHEADVGNRDALKNYQDQQKRDTDTTKEDAAFNLQENNLDNHLDQQLATEQQSYQKSEQSEDASYAKRYQQDVTALNNAQVAENRAAGLALGYQKQAQDAQTNQSLQFYNELIAIGAHYLPQIENQFLTTMQNILANAAPSFGGYGPYAGNNLPAAPMPTSQIQKIVDNRIVTLIAEA